MSEPITVGTRVKYLGASRPGLVNTATVSCVLFTGLNEQFSVEYDDGHHHATIGLLRSALEVIAPAIDTSKPLVSILGDEEIAVKLICRDDDGGYVVDVSDTDLAGNWIRYDRNGNYATSDRKCGYGRKLRNASPKPVVETVFIRVPSYGRPTFHPGAPGGTCVADVELTFTDGIVTDAKLTRSNTVAIDVDRLTYGV
jgi:hypothetical protein